MLRASFLINLVVKRNIVLYKIYTIQLPQKVNKQKKTTLLFMKSEANPKGLELCLRCGEAMVETYCKSICTNCGYMRDCNDQW